ncbi:MAG: cytochrome B, partial [Calditrichaeota bacterium]|nr:cytochrome B [Calditrichota bacterium]
MRDWLNERYKKAQPILDLLVNKTVPLHKHSLWYYFGGLTLFFFVIQVVTGILLLLYYQPSAGTAYESVRYIMTEVPFGWLIRSIHSWSANLFIGSLFIHMFSVFFLKAYRRPRELTWVTGGLMLFIALGFGFTGYLLPWNELAFFATKVGTDIAAVVPVVGSFVLRFLRGGEEVTGGTLTRLFGFHVAVLPALAFLVLGLHLALIQIQGMSVPLSVEKQGGVRKQIPFFPNFLLRDLVGWLL